MGNAESKSEMVLAPEFTVAERKAEIEFKIIK